MALLSSFYKIHSIFTKPSQSKSPFPLIAVFCSTEGSLRHLNPSGPVSGRRGTEAKTEGAQTVETEREGRAVCRHGERAEGVSLTFQSRRGGLGCTATSGKGDNLTGIANRKRLEWLSKERSWAFLVVHYRSLCGVALWEWRNTPQMNQSFWIYCYLFIYKFYLVCARVGTWVPQYPCGHQTTNSVELVFLFHLHVASGERA